MSEKKANGDVPTNPEGNTAAELENARNRGKEKIKKGLLSGRLKARLEFALQLLQVIVGWRVLSWVSFKYIIEGGHKNPVVGEHVMIARVRRDALPSDVKKLFDKQAPEKRTIRILDITIKQCGIIPKV